MFSRRRKVLWVIGILILVIAIGIGIFAAIGSYRMGLIPSMSVEEMINYTTEDNDEALITIGIIKDGEMTYKVYGKDGAVLPTKEYSYEIGSVTKTFTASLLCKAISENRVSITDSVDKYIDLPKNKYYPTLEKLVTHTSGYKGYYFDWQMASNFIGGEKNDFYNISKENLNNHLAKNILNDTEYQFEYSNFGFAVIGEALANIYGDNYNTIMNDFIQSDLGLKHTRISDGTGDLSGYWNWKYDDAYIPAGAIISTIGDMMEYINLQMSDEIPYLSMGHKKILNINADNKQYEEMNINMDAIGIGWIIDETNNFIWHNGGTSNFNSYVAFDKEKQMGIVILSNLSPNYRIPATVMGSKILTDLQNEYK